MRISISVRIDFLNISYAKCLVSNPRHPDSDPKITRRINLDTSNNKYTFVVKGNRKTLEMDSLDPFKIDENPSLDHEVSSLVLPRVPGSSLGLPGHQSGGTRHAK